MGPVSGLYLLTAPSTPAARLAATRLLWPNGIFVELQLGHYVIVRFRSVRHRLAVDLVETSRENGKVKSEHIARLGSVALPGPIDVRERVRFWRELKGRFREIAVRLANRVGADDRRKALAAIHARIAKPTEGDEQDARIETTRDDLRFWEQSATISRPPSRIHTAV